MAETALKELSFYGLKEQLTLNLKKNQWSGTDGVCAGTNFLQWSCLYYHLAKSL